MVEQYPPGMAIRSIAAYAPPTVVTNDTVAERLEEERVRYERQLGRELTRDEKHVFRTNDRWIRQNIGFTERRFVADGEGTIDLAVRASQLLIELGGIDPATFDFIVFATVTPSYLYSPPDVALLQHLIGIPESINSRPHEVGGAVVSLACSSWVAALRLSYALIRSGQAKRILLIGADAMSRTINWRDRAFACVLGDVGTATELVAVPNVLDMFGPNNFWSWLGGSQSDIIITPKGGSRAPLMSEEDLLAYLHRLAMDGPIVRERMVDFVGGPATEAALEKVGWSLSDLHLAVLHEANRVLNGEIIQRWRARGFEGEVLDAGGCFGNTTSGSIPLALAINGEALEVGKHFGLFGFGGGLSASFATRRITNTIRVFTRL